MPNKFDLSEHGFLSNAVGRVMFDLWKKYAGQEKRFSTQDDGFKYLARRLYIEMLKLTPLEQRSEKQISFAGEGDTKTEVYEPELERYYFNFKEEGPARNETDFVRTNGDVLKINNTFTATTIRNVLMQDTKPSFIWVLAFTNIVGISLEDLTDELYRYLDKSSKPRVRFEALFDSDYVKEKIGFSDKEDSLNLRFIHLPFSKDAEDGELLKWGNLKFEGGEKGVLTVSGEQIEGDENISLTGSAVVTLSGTCWCFLRRRVSVGRHAIWAICFKIRKTAEGLLDFRLPCVAASMTLYNSEDDLVMFRVMLYEANAQGENAYLPPADEIKLFLGHIKLNNRKIFIKESDWKITEAYLKCAAEKKDAQSLSADEGIDVEKINEIERFFEGTKDMEVHWEVFKCLAPQNNSFSELVVIDLKADSSFKAFKKVHTNGQVLDESPALYSWLRKTELSQSCDVINDELNDDVEKTYNFIKNLNGAL